MSQTKPNNANAVRQTYRQPLETSNQILESTLESVDPVERTALEIAERTGFHGTDMEKVGVHYFMRTIIAIASLLLYPALLVRVTDPLPTADLRGSGDSLLVHDVGSWDESLYEEHQFAQRFNKLILALQSFSETYNSGHVIDVKRVKAVKKAWHNLEKSDWFKPDNTD